MSDIPELEFSNADWAEIYYALDAYAQRIDRGELGPDNAECRTGAWAAHLRGIMAQIAEVVDV